MKLFRLGNELCIISLLNQMDLTFWGLESENDSISTNTKVAIAESVFEVICS